MSKKIALITGITGQDGSYLTESLLEDGYYVHGIVRKSSNFGRDRIEHLKIDEKYREKLYLHYGDNNDFANIFSLLSEIRPSEIYNLAAQSHVKISFELPDYTIRTNTQGLLNILESTRLLKLESKIYQASSSEMYGNSGDLLNENSKFEPVSPYGVSKLAAHNLVHVYRKSYGIFVVGGILFNHESPRRHETFVTRKISKAVAQIAKGSRKNLELGNIEAKRDWGYAPEYVEAMRLMMNRDVPEDLVIASGESHSVRNFLDLCFSHVGLNWQEFVTFNVKYERPIEIENLTGVPNKASQLLGWSAKIKIKELAKIMVEHDLNHAG